MLRIISVYALSQTLFSFFFFCNYSCSWHPVITTAKAEGFDIQNTVTESQSFSTHVPLLLEITQKLI